ncbi:MAG: 50S ribosomal protein L11 methyltransferase [Bacillota bacterium]|nr:50S ribosomal protein L11 methyltransferase [Bacillota bacterium]
MRWQEVVVSTNHEAVEAISNFLHEVGAGGVVIEDPLVLQEYTSSGQWDYYDIPTEQLESEYVIIKGYLPVDPDLPYRLEDLKAYMTVLKAKLSDCHLEISLNQVEEEDWANSWKVYYKPTKISERVVIVPSWEEYESKPGEETILLDPGMAFGTGTHQTTRLCVKLMEKVISDGEIVYDVGTGSGVLSLIAAKLGAAQVLASDIDRTAVGIANQNISLNNLEQQIKVVQGNLLEPLVNLPTPKVIVANIVADVILLLSKEAFLRLEQGGYLITSGIIKSRQKEVAQALVEAGFIIAEQLEEHEWAAILAKKE